jgi:hypothetical protein
LHPGNTPKTVSSGTLSGSGTTQLNVEVAIGDTGPIVAELYLVADDHKNCDAHDAGTFCVLSK